MGEKVIDVVVIGSANIDMVVRTERLPQEGETVLGGEFKKFFGGKGANQAVTARRAGATTSFIGKVGSDTLGKEILKNLRSEKVDVSGVSVRKDKSSGVALILVDKNGNNIIGVAPGANAYLSKKDIVRTKDIICSSKTVLLQLEIPVDTVFYAIKTAKSKGVLTILNPAPAMRLPLDIFPQIDILIPNEHEAEVLSGIEVKDLRSTKKAGLKLLGYGTRTVVITLGKRGVIVVSKEEVFKIPARKVKAIDTTAAGDAFCGALGAAIATGKDIKSACKLANVYAGLSTTKYGAQSSIPTRSEVLKKFHIS